MIMKKIFRIDWSLMVSFLSSAVTGVMLHMAGHGDSHETWHKWAVANVATSLLFLVFAAWHIKLHFGWYKSWFNCGSGKKSPITALLSAVFAAAVITGIALLGMEGANSGI